MCWKVGLWAVQGYQVMPSVQNIEMRKEKIKSQKDQLCIMQLFTKCNSSVLHSGESHPATAGSTNTGSFTLTVSQLIIKYPLGQKSIPLSPLVSYLCHHGSEVFFPSLSMVTNSFNLFSTGLIESCRSLVLDCRFKSLLR